MHFYGANLTHLPDTSIWCHRKADLYYSVGKHEFTLKYFAQLPQVLVKIMHLERRAADLIHQICRSDRTSTMSEFTKRNVLYEPESSETGKRKRYDCLCDLYAGIGHRAYSL